MRLICFSKDEFLNKFSIISLWSLQNWACCNINVEASEILFCEDSKADSFCRNVDAKTSVILCECAWAYVAGSRQPLASGHPRLVLLHLLDIPNENDHACVSSLDVYPVGSVGRTMDSPATNHARVQGSIDIDTNHISNPKHARGRHWNDVVW